MTKNHVHTKQTDVSNVVWRFHNFCDFCAFCVFFFFCIRCAVGVPSTSLGSSLVVVVIVIVASCGIG